MKGRRGYIQRRVRPKVKGRSRFPHRRCPEYIEWLKSQPCCITGHSTGAWVQILSRRRDGRLLAGQMLQIQVDPMHIRARGAAGDDLWNAVPVAHHLHEESHGINSGIKTFQRKYSVDLKAIAAEYTERYLAEHGDAA
jgi:hypothetical protein